MRIIVRTILCIAAGFLPGCGDNTNPDSEPPSPVTDLAAISVSASSAKVIWKASEDNAAPGFATTYRIRFLNETSASGDTMRSSFSPSSPGADPLSVEIGDLEPGSTYLFQVLAEDAAGNRSGWSDAASALTYRRSDSPENALWNLLHAYRQRQPDQYGRLLRHDFVFLPQSGDTMELGGSWTREEDLERTARHLSAEDVEGIRIDAPHGPARPSTNLEFPYQWIRIYPLFLEVDLSGGKQLRVEDAVQDMYFDQGNAAGEDPDDWYVVAWQDLPVPGGGPPTATPSIALHVAPAPPPVSCEDSPLPRPDEVQPAACDEAGARYVVWVLACNGPDRGILGMEFGIDYDGEPERGVDIDSWTLCADIGFPRISWPEPNSGISFIWNGDNCQTGTPDPGSVNSVVAVGGFFELTYWSPDRLRLIPRPGAGRAVVADCDASEYPLEEERVGTAGFCEEGYNPCLAPVVVQTTWGRLKGMF